jgi:two-component sensor histidine kinase/FixJ family two-component response regulator
MKRVLLIDDNPADRDLLMRHLCRSIDAIDCVEIFRRRDFEAALARGDFDVVITDYQLQWADGLSILHQCLKTHPDIPVIMFTDSGSEEIAVEGMKAGLSDYILKSHPARLAIAVVESLEKARLRRAQREAEAVLKQAKESLECKVAERTAELDALTEALRADIARRQQIEQELRDSQARLQAILQEKEVMLSEVYHRIKNNLQVISSLLDLQADMVADPQVRALFEDSQQRIQAVALLHESLSQARNVTRIPATEYINRLSTQVFQAYAPPGDRVTLSIQVDPIWVAVRNAVPCGLLVNELLSNSLKYAFPGDRGGEITIALRAASEEHMVLVVRDTGVGFPAGTDFRRTNSLGMQLVCLLTEQLGGEIELDRSSGTQWTLRFPVSNL